MSRSITALISVLAILFFSVFSYISSILAQSDSTIGASVDLSVCGDGVVEGQEECEQVLGLQYSCQDYGMGKGETFCDASCAFDFSACVFPNPPITPNPPVSSPTLSPPVTSTFEPIPLLRLPLLLRSYDINRDGWLVADEFIRFVKSWNSSWNLFISKETLTSPQEVVWTGCDVNGDRKCDIFDFSILLYYSKWKNSS